MIKDNFTDQNDQIDWVGKRKSGGMNVIMEDSEVIMKQSCMQQVGEFTSSDIVVEVGQPQPREQL